MRKGFRSSRGAIRGTMGGAPICLVGAVGFATVAIGVGPFIYAICLRNSVLTWPKFKIRLRDILFIHWPQTFWNERRMHHGRRENRSGEVPSAPGMEWKA